MKKVFLITIFVLLFCGQAWADSLLVNHSGNQLRDAHINSHSGNPARRHYNYGSKTTFEIGVGELPACGSVTDQNRLLVYFDISSLPDDAIVDSSFFRARCSSRWVKSGAYHSHNLMAFAVLRDWNEGDNLGTEADAGEVTYSHRYYSPADTACPDDTPPDSCWYKDGADSVANDRESTLQDSVRVFNAGVWYSWDFTDAVQRWHNATLTNNGILIFHEWTDDSCTVYIFNSSEYATLSIRPWLVIYYSTLVGIPGLQPVVYKRKLKKVVDKGTLTKAVDGTYVTE